MRARALAVAAVYSSMADCSKYSVEEAGFDISALKTSLIQYFRWPSRPSEPLLTTAALQRTAAQTHASSSRSVPRVDRRGWCVSEVETRRRRRKQRKSRRGREKFKRREATLYLSGRCFSSQRLPV